MPERIHIPRPESRRQDLHAWLPEAIHGAALAVLAATVPFFVQQFYRVRARLGLEDERGLALIIGFFLIELYLVVRTFRQLRKARDTYRDARRDEGAGD